LTARAAPRRRSRSGSVRARSLRPRRFSRAPALLLKAAMSEAKREPEVGRRAPRTRRGRA
jgi:hypothetical protein